ncbi:acetyl-CoA carboxylase biotin carboxylase subunit family protein [Streptomyces sp. NPDC059063]|uniref:ATP-grasp domain-containing protein n=1 Tax=unclassified Streptomyces TaxID=2593676 RepID=UPI0036758D8F
MATMMVIGYRDDLDQALQQRGLDPYYIVQAPANPPQHRRYTRVADMENAQEILRAVLSANIHDLAGVLSVHEMGVFGAAYLRRELGLPGNADAKAALSFRDKFLQKSRLPPQVERARCRYAARDTPYAELKDELGEPFVVKPATGAGALRTSVVGSPEEYARALDAFPGQSDVAMVAESFVDAPEVYLDGIWRNGELQWSSLSRNHISPLSAVQGGVLAAHVRDRNRHAALFKDAEALAGQALAGLDAPDCVFHLEAFTTEAGLTFGECAIRLPGALSPQVNKLTYGVDLFDIEISLALGEEPTHHLGTTAPDRFYGYVLLRRPRGGRLTQEDFERAFRFDEITYDSSPDAPVGPYGKVGHAIVSDPDELELEQMLDDIARFNETGGGARMR